MASFFITGLLIYYWMVLRRQIKKGAVLSGILWVLYFLLGLSGLFIELTDGILPIFKPNYFSTVVLLIGVLLSISGFLNFKRQNILQFNISTRNQNVIEYFLIISQFLAISFFLPFAFASLIGDLNENRLLIKEKIDVLGSYGLLNTFAGAASQLFSASLVLAFIRLSGKKCNISRAYILIVSSLSYVIYILAYVGRDGIIYWLMTFVVLYFIFRKFLDSSIKKKLLFFIYVLSTLILIPFFIITVSRFADAQISMGWSMFEYFGAQIQNFSDFSSIDRPVTLGLQNFPMFIKAGCDIFNLGCASWIDLREIIFDLYLNQGKAPWVFGTFVSDFVADFGEIGALLFILAFCLLSSYVCKIKDPKQSYSLSRFLLILFLFSIPYWGVFYFRFSIINGYIVVNLFFIFFVMLMGDKQRARRLSDNEISFKCL